MTHTKRYQGLENGAGMIVCSCGFQTPAVDDSTIFTLGIKQRSVESYFEEHLATVGQAVETQMVAPVKEAAVTPAQKPPTKSFFKKRR